MHRGWQSALRRLVRRINLGWWLQCWVPLLLLACLTGAVVILVARSLLTAPMSWLPWCGPAVVLLTAGMAWLRARRFFESEETARVRLEDALGLHSGLTAARLGVAAWPSLPEVLPLPVRWQPAKSMGVIAMSLLLLAAAMLVPITTQAKAGPRVIEKPSAVTQVENWVETLREKDAVDPKSLDEVEKQIEELVHRPQDQWYEHATLEAADHLRNETGKMLQELGAQMEQSRGSLAALAEAGAQAGEEAKSGLSKQAADNLNGLRSGAMKAGGELADQLRGLDPNALNNLSKEQMQQLANRLKQNADALREALANAPQFDFKECARCLSEGEEGTRGEGEGPGKGGVSRGRGDADLTVKKDETQLGTKKSEDLAGMLDVERIAPGDLIGTSDGRQKVDESAYRGPASGGEAGTGEGGAAIRQNQLLPAERNTLKRYFK